LRIIITEWGLDSYLDLLGRAVFSRADYWSTLRPDVKKLLQYPTLADFANGGFWGPAQSTRGIVPDGYKMKWHNLGPGRVQLRACVAILGDIAYVCQAFVKSSPALDVIQGAKLRSRIELLKRGQANLRGELR
jgi:hypothetical protein